MLSVSLILPMRNAKTTILKTLQSLFFQPFNFQELVLIDDASTDGSDVLARNFLKTAKEKYSKEANLKIIRVDRPGGLAHAYNLGLKDSSGDLVVTLHADILLKENALTEIVVPFFKDNSKVIVATYHIVDHPLEVWQKYNFWQKCFFARLAGKKMSGLDGKFDCFRRSALNQINNFDDQAFKNAGEDGDVIFKLKKIGKIVGTKAEIIHLHSIDPNFGPQDIIQKQKQYSESQGILLRKGEIHNLKDWPRIFFREILVLALFLPYVNLFALVLIFFYAFAYTGKMFMAEAKNLRILFLPFLNIYLLFVSFFSVALGFVKKRQE
jgi:glycosyltransferase involved in cell wall biosynthesis